MSIGLWIATGVVLALLASILLITIISIIYINIKKTGN